MTDLVGKRRRSPWTSFDDQKAHFFGKANFTQMRWRTLLPLQALKQALCRHSAKILKYRNLGCFTRLGF